MEGPGLQQRPDLSQWPAKLVVSAGRRSAPCRGPGGPGRGASASSLTCRIHWGPGTRQAAGADAETQRVDRQNRAVALGQAANLDHECLPGAGEPPGAFAVLAG